MLKLALAVAVIAIILVANEIFWRQKKRHGEFSRKFVHITVGSFVAFWPFFLSWNQIRIMSLAFVAGVLLSKKFKVLKAIHSVKRLTWGELSFALAVGGVTFITQDKWIYAVAILQMSLADGLAAVVGTRYGRNNSYKVFGHIKSMAGSLAFYVVSLMLLLLGNMETSFMQNWQLIPVAVLATALENFAVYGLDNLFIPLGVAAILRVVMA